jgi:hypothetical protein
LTPRRTSNGRPCGRTGRTVRLERSPRTCEPPLPKPGRGAVSGCYRRTEEGERPAASSSPQSRAAIPIGEKALTHERAWLPSDQQPLVARFHAGLSLGPLSESKRRSQSQRLLGSASPRLGPGRPYQAL